MVAGEAETSGQTSQIAIAGTKDDVGGQAMEPQLPYDGGKATADMAGDIKGDAAMPGDAASPLSVLWIGYLCVFVDFLGIAISIPILPYFTLELPWDSDTACPSCPQDASAVDFATEGRCGEIDGCGTAFDVGMTNTAFAAGQILGNFLMSKLSDRIGRKPIIMISLLCSALGYMWCGLAPNLYHLYFARIFSGIAGGTLPVVQAMVLDVTGDPRERPKYFGLAGACLGMAFMIGPAVGAVFAALVDKRAALMSPTFIATLVVLIGFLKIHETRPAGGICGPRSERARIVHEEGAAQFAATMAEASEDSLATRDKPSVRLPRLVYVCTSAMVLSSFSFSTMTAMCALTWPISYNLGPTELGIFLMGIGCVGIFNNVVVIKRVAARFGPLRVVLVSSLVQCLGITSFTFIDLLDPGSMVIFIPYVIFFTACIIIPWDMQMPNLITIAGNSVAPEIRGMTTGLVASGMSLGMALAPMVAGALFMTDFLSLEHAYGTFSHSVFVLGGVMSIVEFVLLIAFVGCTQKT
jgi:MFS family permease